MKQKKGISNKRLDTELIKDGFVQNRGKQVSLPVMAGRGCQEQRRLLKEGWGKGGGVLTECDRYLGPQVHSRLHNTPELDKRVLLTRQAFFSMGKLWFCPRLAMVRTVFICKVQNAALSSMETLILTPGEEAKLDRVVAGLGRLAMKGSACCKLEDGKHRAAPNAGVFAHWRVASTAVELKLRRLGMMQEWARDPENHQQVIAAVFGNMQWEREDTYKDGKGICVEGAKPLGCEGCA